MNLQFSVLMRCSVNICTFVKFNCVILITQYLIYDSKYLIYDRITEIFKLEHEEVVPLGTSFHRYLSDDNFFIFKNYT